MRSADSSVHLGLAAVQRRDALREAPRVTLHRHVHAQLHIARAAALRQAPARGEIVVEGEHHAALLALRAMVALARVAQPVEVWPPGRQVELQRFLLQHKAATPALLACPQRVHPLAPAGVTGGAGNVQVASASVAQQVVGVAAALTETAGAAFARVPAIAAATRALPLPEDRVVAHMSRKHRGCAHQHVNLNIRHDLRGEEGIQLNGKSTRAHEQLERKQCVTLGLRVQKNRVYLQNDMLFSKNRYRYT